MDDSLSTYISSSKDSQNILENSQNILEMRRLFIFILSKKLYTLRGTLMSDPSIFVQLKMVLLNSDFQRLFTKAVGISYKRAIMEIRQFLNIQTNVVKIEGQCIRGFSISIKELAHKLGLEIKEVASLVEIGKFSASSLENNEMRDRKDQPIPVQLTPITPIQIPVQLTPKQEELIQELTPKQEELTQAQEVAQSKVLIEDEFQLTPKQEELTQVQEVAQSKVLIENELKVVEKFLELDNFQFKYPEEDDLLSKIAKGQI